MLVIEAQKKRVFSMGFEMMYGRVKSAAARLLHGEGLRAKAATGGAWLGGGSAAEQASRFVRNMVLTRLLAPSAFGAMAIVLSASSLVASLSDVGLWPAVIQNPRGADAEYLNAGWWLGMLRAVFMYAIIFGAAPWVARFYGIADLSALLRVVLVSTILDGMLSPNSKLAHKKMKFGRWAFISNGGGICGVITTIVLSFYLRNVWALAIGFCSENAFRCVFSYILFPGLPSLGWDNHAVRDLLNFSKGMFGLSFLNLIFARTDIFVFGKLFPPAALGIYTLAVYLVQTPSGFLISLLSTTLLPVFAHVQEDTERVNRILGEVTSWAILLGMPAVAMLWLCGSSLLTVAYGARYAAGAGALAVAAGVVFLNVLNSLLTTLFFANGRPGLHRRAVAVSAVIMVIAIYPACRHLGMVGGQVAALIASAASYLLQIERAHKVTGLKILRYGQALVPAMLVSAGILMIGFGARFLGLATKPLANIAIAAAACLLAYALCVPVFIKIREAA